MIFHSTFIHSKTSRLRLSKRTVVLFAAVAGLASPDFVSAATTATWNGTTGNWSDPTKWSTNPLVPTNTSYDVVINAGFLTNDVNPVIQTLTWNGGSIIGGTLLTNGGISFTGVNFTDLSGTLSNGAGQTATMGSAGANGLYLRGNGTLVNAGVLTAYDGLISTAGGYFFQTVNNTGTLNVNLNNSAGTFDVAVVAFNNAGAVNVQRGGFTITSGGASSGIFNVAAGTSLVFSGSFSSPTNVLSSGATLNVAGTLAFIGGNFAANGTSYNVTGAVLVSGGVASFNASALFAAPVAQSGGTIDGSGSLTVNGLYTWSGGKINIANLKANGGLSLTGAAFTDLSGTLTNGAGQTATMGSAGANGLYLRGNGTLVNAGVLTAYDGLISTAGGYFFQTVNNTGTLNVNLNNSAGTFDVAVVAFNNAGAVNVQRGGLSIHGNSNVTTGSYGVVADASLISDGLRAATLTVDGNAMIRGTSAVTGTSKVAGLSMSHTGSVYSGVLNINNTHFIIQPSSGDKAVQLAAVSAAIASAKGSGNWLGNGLTSATTAADPLNKTIAVADNAILGLTTFGGLPVDGNSILLVSTWLGDANLDRSVNVSDLGTLATNYGHPTTLGAVAGDFNIDGVINVTDLGLLATNYGKGTGGGAFNLESEPTPEVTPYSSFAASIPEPGTLLLLGFPFLMSRKSRVIKGSRRGGRQGRSIRVL